jgi:hypothetical protein
MCDEAIIDYLLKEATVNEPVLHGDYQKERLLKAQHLTDNIVHHMKALNNVLGNVMCEDLPEKLGFSRIKDSYENMCERIKRQDHGRPTNRVGQALDISEYVIVFVDDQAGVRDMLDAMISIETATAPSSICVDLEGNNLGRHGNIQLMQLYQPNLNTIYLLDIDKLHAAAFTTTSSIDINTTLKSVLVGHSVRKPFFDCRSDSAALYFQYDIKLDATAVDDLQLYELATTRKWQDRRKVNSLGTAVGRCRLFAEQHGMWDKMKREGKNYMKDGPNWVRKHAAISAQAQAQFHGVHSAGDDAVDGLTQKLDTTIIEDSWDPATAWKLRPLPQDLKDYACGDVIVLPILADYFFQHERLTAPKLDAIKDETSQRISQSQQDSEPELSNKGPAGWANKTWCQTATD